MHYWVDWNSGRWSLKRGWRALFLCACCTSILAQEPISFQYFYDDLNQLARVVDSTGVAIEYVYDSVGNILQINRSTISPSALTIFNVTPRTAATGATITIQGQGFSPNASLDRVTIGGAPVTVISATGTTLVVMIPNNGMSGPISVMVGGSTATSEFNETVILTPIISSVQPRAILASTVGPVGTSVVVTGVNLTGSSFSFSPTIGLSITSASTNPSGTSATLSITAAPNLNGRFALVASTSIANSGLSITPANSFGAFTNPNADADNDGLANAYELLLGTDPFNPDTDGDGFSDGVEVATGSDPLNPLCTPLNCRVSGGEADASNFSILNIALPSSSFHESDGVLFSVLNTGLPPTLFHESDSVLFSVCNVLNGPCGSSVNVPTTLPTAGSNETRMASPGMPVDDSRASVPEIVAITPMSSVGPGVYSVTLIFSEPMDPQTLSSGNIQLLAEGKPLRTSIVISSDFRSVTLDAKLPADAVITLLATSKVASLFGNGLAEYRSDIDTRLKPASMRTVMQFPVNGAGDVPIDVPIFLDIGRPLDANSAILATQITQNDEPVQGTITVEGTSVRFLATAPFSSGAIVTVSLTSDARDTSGNSVPAYQGTFVAAGTRSNAPTSIRAVPIYTPGVELSPVIEIEFDRPLDPASININNVTLQHSDGRPVPAAVTLRDSRIVRISPYAPLMPDALYDYQISTEVRDLSGASPTFSLRRSFRTRARSTPLERPTAEITPSDGSRNIASSSVIKIRLSSEVNPLSVTGKTVRVTTSGGDVIPCSISFGARFHEIILSPLQPLPEGMNIITTMAGLETSSGRVIAQQVTQFLTGPTRSIASGKKRGSLSASFASGISMPISLIGSSGGGTSVTFEKPVDSGRKRK